MGMLIVLILPRQPLGKLFSLSGLDKNLNVGIFWDAVEAGSFNLCVLILYTFICVLKTVTHF